MVSSGIVATPHYGGMPEVQRQGMHHEIARQLPVGRVAQPKDIAETYVYVAKNGYTTGTSVLIVEEHI
ncbi:hypothetical protein ACFVAD_19230 [Sutcliffiella sp. NPDC057660]|uniref:hypothetical protein n=1 Tax=Sutcliffiella sp. NPDC057660 TaxID=3346199 RepID=UPI0036808C82